ncbi:MAG: DUF4126 domain-containing protein [Acidobacteriota bacterium]|nr:DUF4126 domain-containing protein [Acidobacteriota bacterium]MDQ2840601.1 DUF4126 domain-containing protein [Acidobacteriota bacterium]
MDLSTLGFAMGSAWLSGINLYATVLTLGLLQRFHAAHLPGDLGYLGHTWVLVVAAVLYLVQFIADKIPAVDSAWDMVHTFIRVPAGAVLAAAAFAHLDPAVRIAALLLGGGIALSSHGTKTATRLAANVSPEPFSNILLSLVGDALTVGGTLLMSIHPAILIAIVLIALIVSVLFFRWIRRSMSKIFGRRPALSAR